MRIVIDGMGGDKAPEEIIKGAVSALDSYEDIELIITGIEKHLNRELNKYNFPEDRVKIIPASEIISMNESPSKALRKKKDSSIVKGINLVKEDKATAFISAGNTGAVMAGGLFLLGRLPSIKRPAIATVFPSRNGGTLVIDAGANVDSKPENLNQFAIMGQIYSKHVLGVKNPRVGLLSIGEEQAKGNQLTKGAFSLLDEDKRIINFVGNVEGRDIFNGSCDVVVCDGFVGNVVLKTTEGAASYIFDLIKDTFNKNILTKLSGLMIKPFLKKQMALVDYRQYGGAPLLGVNGVVIISHGSSNSTAIKNAIKVAKETVNKNVVGLIKQEINKDGE
ncbi:phosphate acyltransferase PlsX [Halothermothrix orenii]|uniref:Phosphate acyltransferase n=1 Tax=Halothermothrix orenii (strain H 168 / OCM 544 / DSM 9562) TaxID=373903 RepID=PLSX_HALOH|nr:phosphate acyltransferase PlsX [Halothermothrix orenii]B8CWW2.1 RecName: Full=Phosphate acyltransferase; AltName: Full=Acyl-ACP phosphotransacylase; AltName: Full=Acyl-[acyl-carrier-protein]--phosphate acyltransferase; AltName: Full=Phosphate-acyl-ACP acyltransferase [Halothermothrix orenii H 168]ACL69781.1 phosphate acyl-(acyl carrier protein) acyltransferase [Halothermothrix orenii H 168]